MNYGRKGIGQYSENEPWENFIERLSGHLDACNIKNATQRRDILVSTVGADTYALMKNLLGEEKPREKTYDELVALMKCHKPPTPPWQSERIKFLNRDRRKDETVMEYLAVLKKMMSTCKYSAVEYNNQLRDRLLHGCKDSDMQKAIIDVGEDLTLEDAVKAALQHEARLRSLKELCSVSGEEQANYVSPNCWRCGGRHPPDRCRYKQEKCHQCHKMGHLRRCCPNRQSNNSRPGQRDQPSEPTSGRLPDRGRGRTARGRYGGPRGRRRDFCGRSGGQYRQHQTTDVGDSEYGYDYDVDEYDAYEMNEHAYDDVNNKMSAVYVDEGEKCVSPSMSDVACKSPSMSDDVASKSPSMCDEVHFGIHVVNTKQKDDQMVNSVKSVKPYHVEMIIEGKQVQMEVDTGAA